MSRAYHFGITRPAADVSSFDPLSWACGSTGSLTPAWRECRLNLRSLELGLRSLICHPRDMANLQSQALTLELGLPGGIWCPLHMQRGRLKLLPLEQVLPSHATRSGQRWRHALDSSFYPLSRCYHFQVDVVRFLTMVSQDLDPLSWACGRGSPSCPSPTT